VWYGNTTSLLVVCCASYSRVVKRVHVIAATGRSGLALCRALAAGGVDVVPVVRSPDKFAVTALPFAPRQADLGDAAALAAALGDASHIASAAHARHAGAILAAAPAGARVVLMGSTRRFTKWPDEHGRGVIAGEAALHAWGGDGVMLHPTMIYGAAGEDNVRRLAALMRRHRNRRVLPLPGGGRNLVQPIHQDDVTACVVAALERHWGTPRALVVAGPAPMRYADFMRTIAAAAGLAPPWIVPVPAALLMAASSLTLLPGLPRIRPAEVRRLMEDKAFDTGDMRALLGVHPMGLEEGLARTFADPPSFADQGMSWSGRHTTGTKA
jgi:nucleoside-diphosphate-sugar epimerase